MFDPKHDSAKTSSTIEVKRAYNRLVKVGRDDLAEKVREPTSNVLSRGEPPQIQAARDAAKQAFYDGDLDENDLAELSMGRLRW